MPTFRQKFLKPGRYHVGSGKFRQLSAEDLAKYVAGTQALIEAGHAISVQYEHAEPGSEDGAPQQFSSERDRKAAQVKNGVGWLKGIKLGTDGAAEYVLAVNDPTAAAELKDGSIKFTSPELRRDWTDGQGRKFEHVISHVALTHKPRAQDQGQLAAVADADTAVLQFSLDDWIQLADDDGDGNPFKKKKDGDGDGESGEGKGNGDGESTEIPDPTAGKPEEPSNPDSPEDTGKVEGRAQRIEAIMAHFEKKGLAMPVDTAQADIDTFLDRLLTALMTSNKAEEQAEADKVEDEPEEEEAPPVVEANTSPVQFSLADAESNKLENKLLARIIRQEHAAVVQRLNGLVSAGRITPALRDGLLKRDTVLQFSADGDERPSYTLAEVSKLLATATLPTLTLGLKPAEAEQFSVAEHPDGDDFFAPPAGRIVSDAEADMVARSVFKRRGAATATA